MSIFNAKCECTHKASNHKLLTGGCILCLCTRFRLHCPTADAGKAAGGGSGGGGGGGLFFPAPPLTQNYVAFLADPALPNARVLGTDIVRYGTLAARGAANLAGRLYFASDSGFMYRDNGASWDLVDPTTANFVLRGTNAARPAAGITGRLYYTTDSPLTTFRDNGVTWDTVSANVSAPGADKTVFRSNGTDGVWSANVIVTDPSAAAGNLIAPTTSPTWALILRASTNTPGGGVAIFACQDVGGTISYFKVDHGTGRTVCDTDSTTIQTLKVLGGQTGPANDIMTVTNRAETVPYFRVRTTGVVLPSISDGVSGNGSGLKHGRVTGGTIAAGGSAVGVVTITWTTAFADNNYTCTVAVECNDIAPKPTWEISSKDATQVTVRVANTSTVSTLTPTVHFIAIHD